MTSGAVEVVLYHLCDDSDRVLTAVLPLAVYFLLLGTFVLAVGMSLALGTPRLRRLLGRPATLSGR